MLFIQLFLTNRPAGETLAATPLSHALKKARIPLESALYVSFQHLMLSVTSFSLMSTSIISFPTWQMSQNGITYSFSRPKKPHMQPGPGNQGQQTARFHVEIHISHKSKALAGLYINHFFLFKVVNPHGPQPPGLSCYLLYAGHRPIKTRFYINSVFIH